jgi:hypothetical protein
MGFLHSYVRRFGAVLVIADRVTKSFEMERLTRLVARGPGEGLRVGRGARAARQNS